MISYHTVYEYIVLLYVLDLEHEENEGAEESGTADIIIELRHVQGLNFCCGEGTSRTVFAAEHLKKIARNSRGVTLNRTALPDYNYYEYKHRNGPPAQNADERRLVALRR